MSPRRPPAPVSGRDVVGVLALGICATMVLLGWAVAADGTALVLLLALLGMVSLKACVGAALYYSGRAVHLGVTRELERRRVLRSRRADRRVGSLSVAVADGALSETAAETEAR